MAWQHDTMAEWCSTDLAGIGRRYIRATVLGTLPVHADVGPEPRSSE
jgi:hypothetical protein